MPKQKIITVSIAPSKPRYRWLGFANWRFTGAFHSCTACPSEIQLSRSAVDGDRPPPTPIAKPTIASACPLQNNGDGNSIAQLLHHSSVKTLLSAAPVAFPNLHGRSRLAKVPVMMYHDVLPQQKVYFDTTEQQLKRDFEFIRENDLTPITLEQLVVHLRTGLPLPEKPILLTFDDGYASHYQFVYPLLKEYGYPAVFSIFTGKLDGEIVGRSTVSWEQVREMAADPLVTIAAHTVTHPSNLTLVSNAQLQREVVESKRILETQLGIPIRYFTYPEGYYDDRVAQAVAAAGYDAALTMDKETIGRFAGESESLLAIDRFGSPNLQTVASQAWGGSPAPLRALGFNFAQSIERQEVEVDGVLLLLATGGKPATILADSRYQVGEILAKTEAIAGVPGAFFSMEILDSNDMIGPVLSQSTRQFVPSRTGMLPRLVGRPLVLISPSAVRFVPFAGDRHNTLAGFQAELSNVTDGFVAAARLVKDGEPQPASSFGTLPNSEDRRQRSFWGINASGQPVIGITNERLDAVAIGVLLAKAGFQDAVMLDSGASTSMVYEGESLVGFIPRPVPHVVALMPPLNCAIAASQLPRTP
ncbi:MAG: polysaccharide deacetylase family protein [Leptolyngbyaceae cyanobacterium SM1_3_5]|nr:polysaccharide deacetylase family protein [Leptolyngbyaceae cyanobacterium SM1_3_5]